MGDTLEQTFQAHLFAELNAPRGNIRVERQNVGTVPVRDERGAIQRWFRAGPRKGAADLRGIVRPEGWVLEVECKAAKGAQRMAQKRREAFIKSFGGIYVLVRYDEAKTMDQNVAAAMFDIKAAITGRSADQFERIRRWSARA